MTDPSAYGCPERPGDAAAYVLGALDAAEALAFERHLDSCMLCRDEVGALRHVTEALPRAVPQLDAPPALKRKVLRDFRAEHRERRSEHREPRRRTAPRLRLTPAWAGGGLATFAVAVVATFAVLGGGGSGARLVSAEVFGAGHASVRITGNHGELVVHGMPQPGAGHIYEVWLKRGDSAPAPTSALFDVTSGGDGVIDIPGNLHAVNTVMVTREPSGGSHAPTSSPVIVASLPS